MIRGVEIRGDDLSLSQLHAVAVEHTPVYLTRDPEVLDKVYASCDFIIQAVESNQPIYGVTSGFGGMADVCIPQEEATDLQNNLLWFLKSGAGGSLPVQDVRAGMLLRANSLMRGASGIRLEIIRRMELFLNAGVHPHVRELGSIGASGDLVPLSSVAGALVGLDDTFKVEYQGEMIPSTEALKRLGLPRIRLAPKEGLALVNGTSVMTGIAANCLYEAKQLVATAIAANALIMQALAVSDHPYDAFVHENKPHEGQLHAASLVRALLDGSRLVHEGQPDWCRCEESLLQDRYSNRCYPQYLGPVLDSLRLIEQQIVTEMNSATDNPLIDVNRGKVLHCGNFLGQYIGISMDQLRYQIGLVAKHLDTQIALLVQPEFSGGLPPSLVGNTERRVNMGLKGLQIAGNSIMPMLTFLGAPLVHHYPTHAEQFNQNVNSLGFGAANMARQSVALFREYLAVTMLFAIQAVDLRTRKVAGHYNAREYVSDKSRPFYDAIHTVLHRASSEHRPYLWNDNEQALDEHIQWLSQDLANGGVIAHSVDWLIKEL